MAPVRVDDEGEGAFVFHRDLSTFNMSYLIFVLSHDTSAQRRFEALWNIVACLEHQMFGDVLQTYSAWGTKQADGEEAEETKEEKKAEGTIKTESFVGKLMWRTPQQECTLSKTIWAIVDAAHALEHILVFVRGPSLRMFLRALQLLSFLCTDPGICELVLSKETKMLAILIKELNHGNRQRRIWSAAVLLQFSSHRQFHDALVVLEVLPALLQQLGTAEFYASGFLNPLSFLEEAKAKTNEGRKRIKKSSLGLRELQVALDRAVHLGMQFDATVMMILVFLAMNVKYVGLLTAKKKKTKNGLQWILSLLEGLTREARTRTKPPTWEAQVILVGAINLLKWCTFMNVKLATEIRWNFGAMKGLSVVESLCAPDIGFDPALQVGFKQLLRVLFQNTMTASTIPGYASIVGLQIAPRFCCLPECVSIVRVVPGGPTFCCEKCNRPFYCSKICQERHCPLHAFVCQ